MNQRRAIGFFVGLVFIGAFVLAGTAGAQNLGFKVRLYGGLGYLAGGDLNSGLSGIPDAYSDAGHGLGYPVAGEYKGAHLGPAFGGDFIIQVTPSFGIGLGAGYVQASKESTVTVTVPGATVSAAAKPDFHAIPVKLSLFYSAPAGPMTINLHAGLGLYNAKASANIRLAEDGYWENLLSETNSKWGLGFHGGLGLEFNVASSVALFIEAQGQYARLKGFEGTVTDTTDYGFNMTETGKLYYFEEQMFMGNYYPWVLIRDTQPSGPGFRNVREASVDFSGGELLAGIVIKF